MELEVGKYYKRRDGKKAFVAGIKLPNPFYERLGIYSVTVYSGASSYSTTIDGRYSAIEEDDLDLVAEWKEPARGEAWLNVYHGFQFAYGTRKEADDAARAERIACKKIEWVEGEGLEGDQE